MEHNILTVQSILMILAGACMYAAAKHFGRTSTIFFWLLAVPIGIFAGITTNNILLIVFSLVCLLFAWQDWKNSE